MTLIVGVAEAHDRLSELIDRAVAGDEVVVAKRSQPIVRLVPISGATKGRGADLAAIAEQWLSGHHPGRKAEDIDADVAAERDSWDRGYRCTPYG